MKYIKQLFCKHDWEFVIIPRIWGNIHWGMAYKRCRKCGKIKNDFKE